MAKGKKQRRSTPTNRASQQNIKGFLAARAAHQRKVGEGAPPSVAPARTSAQLRRSHRNVAHG